MRFLYLFYILGLLLVTEASAQEQFTISGLVKDAETGEPLPGATVALMENHLGDVTDKSGKYALTLTEGVYEISVSFIGYSTKMIVVELDSNEHFDISLLPYTYQTAEVVITGQVLEENLIKTVDKISLSKEVLDNIPYLLGEKDPLKALQLLPGVQSSGEGGNGLYVRGGAIDQNLILFDQTPVYNTGHLFGFFSLFNPSIIETVSLIKGGIPTNYGGRLSSIIEINSRSGNYTEYQGEGNVGVVSGNFSIEGPIVKDKASFIFCGRRTYIDLLSKLATGNPDIFNTGIDYHFSDLNAKIDAKLSSHDKISFSAFTGTDDFGFDGKNKFSNTIKWKNHTASLQWDHFYNDKNYHTTSFFASNFKLDFTAGINEYFFSIFSSIQEYGLKTVWNINSIKNHQLTYGFEYINHALVPNNIKAKGSNIDFKLVEQEKLFSQEQAIFIQDEINLWDKLTLKGGLRFSSYQQLGPFTRYVSDESMALQDTLTHDKGNIIQTYWNLDPRIFANYRLGTNSSIKISYDEMHQYLHMAPVSSVSLPTDVWVPSSAKLKPQKSKQYSLGYFRNFDDNAIETSITSYYKTMDNQVEYRDGVIVGYSKGFNYDDNFIIGKGKSYGLEVLLKKNKGKLTGWLSYTLSKTTRTFKDINQGERFAAKYDRLHNFSWVSHYELNERWSVSGVFTYASGNAMTLPVGRYIINGNVINEYAGRNTFRMPAYHRMDISFIYNVIQRENYESSLIFSIYNLYNRKNPYYIYFEAEGNINDYSLEVKIEKVSLFPIIPSVAWQFKF